MDEPESVPEDDIGVFDACVGVRGDPFGESAGGGTRGLRHVAAGGVELVVFV